MCGKSKVLKRILLSPELPWILALLVFFAPLFFFLVMASPYKSMALVISVFATWILAVLIQGLRIFLSGGDSQ